MSLTRAMAIDNGTLARSLGEGDPVGNFLLGSNAGPLVAAAAGPSAGAVGGYGSRRLTPYVDVRVRGGTSQPTPGGSPGGGGGGDGRYPLVRRQIV